MSFLTPLFLTIFYFSDYVPFLTWEISFFQLLYSLEPIGLNSGSKVDVGVGYQKGLL